MFERAAVFSGLLVLAVVIMGSQIYFDYIDQKSQVLENTEEVTSATDQADN